MIKTIIPLPVGNAIQIFLEPPLAASKWLVLRKTTNDISGVADAAAYNVYEGSLRFFVDDGGLQNGVPYFYVAFYWDGSAWTPSASATCTPSASYSDLSTDAFVVVRDRLVAGIGVELARKSIQAKTGVIEVKTAPPIWEATHWPVVSLALQMETPQERGVGEDVWMDDFDGQFWNEHVGWLARVQLAIVAWCQNPDERIALRQAIRRIVVANLPVFESHGMIKVELSQQHADAVSGEYPAPVYQAVSTFSCLAPILVGSQVDPITDVTVTATAIEETL